MVFPKSGVAFPKTYGPQTAYFRVFLWRNRSLSAKTLRKRAIDE